MKTNWHLRFILSAVIILTASAFLVQQFKVCYMYQEPDGRHDDDYLNPGNHAKHLDRGIVCEEPECKQYDLRIIAIVNNRHASLKRLLESLNRALYGNDSIKLEVWIDRSKDGTVDEKTLSVAKAFEFLHGEYSVNVHRQHVGIYGQWLQTWLPQPNSSEIGVILEDDLTVSPYFYKYLKQVHSKYDSYPKINGFALQGVSIKHSGGSGFVEAPKTETVYLYPVVGSWGYSPSPEKWVKFVHWFYDVKKNSSFIPDVPGNVASSWYKQFIQEGRTDGMWTMWYIYYAWKNKEFSLYSNFKDHVGLSSNWREKGLHDRGNSAGPSNKLLEHWSTDYEKLPDEPVKLDISGKPIK